MAKHRRSSQTEKWKSINGNRGKRQQRSYFDWTSMLFWININIFFLSLHAFDFQALCFRIVFRRNKILVKMFLSFHVIFFRFVIFSIGFFLLFFFCLSSLNIQNDDNNKTPREKNKEKNKMFDWKKINLLGIEFSCVDFEWMRFEEEWPTFVHPKSIDSSLFFFFFFALYSADSALYFVLYWFDICSTHVSNHQISSFSSVFAVVIS